MYKGIFWGIPAEDALITKKVLCDATGLALFNVEYSSKSGDNFNHKIEWEKFKKTVRAGHSYNFYPRGRVEIRDGDIKIFLSTYFAENSNLLALILKTFELFDENEEALKEVKLIFDNSMHYQYGEDGY